MGEIAEGRRTGPARVPAAAAVVFAHSADIFPADQGVHIQFSGMGEPDILCEILQLCDDHGPSFQA